MSVSVCISGSTTACPVTVYCDDAGPEYGPGQMTRLRTHWLGAIWCSGRPVHMATGVIDVFCIVMLGS